MTHQLFWKLCLIIGTGVVAMFYLIDQTVSRIENNMSLIAEDNRRQLNDWGRTAESIYLSGDQIALEQWLDDLQREQDTWATIAQAEVTHIAGSVEDQDHYSGYNLGRNVNWQIHLYFEHNPIMELPFADGKTSLLIRLPMHMRPGSYWDLTQIFLQIILPMAILIILSIVLYRHIMLPLRQLEAATRSFSEGRFEVRVREMLGRRDDELAQLADTFDQMAGRIGELIVNQRQLITDLSHELRTPLTRLDVAVGSLILSELDPGRQQEALERIHRESRHIRKLVDDTLTLSWLENEAPKLDQESIDLVDLLEVLIDDARFEYPDRNISANLPDAADIENSNHRVLVQALENILRNALRYTPAGKNVTISLIKEAGGYEIRVSDEGPGVPEQHLTAIFRPFFRVDSSRPSGSSFGLGLALAKRQLAAIAATISAQNLNEGGLMMTVMVPRS